MNDNSNEFTQRSMRAIILCVMVAIIYTQFVLAPQKRAEQQAVNAQRAATSGQVGGSQVAGAPVGASTGVVTQQGAIPAAVPSTQAAPSVDEISRAAQTKVDLGVANLTITHLGGRLASYKLRDYRRDQQSDEALDLIGGAGDGALPLGVYVGSESDERVVYSLAQVNGAASTSPELKLPEFKLSGGEKLVLDFRGTLPSGNGITKRMTFVGGANLYTVDLLLDRPAPAGQLAWLEWTHFYSSAVEAELRVKHMITSLDSENKIQRKMIEEVGQGVSNYGSNRWVSLGDTYFTTALIPTVTSANTMLGRSGDLYITRVAGTPTGGQFHAYSGAKDYKQLEQIGDFGLERTIDLGWFSFLALPLLWLLRFLHSLVGNWGVAIIGLTLLVKAVMLPLSRASMQSAKKMQELQPEIKALRERIKDPNQLNQEMFALYKRKGVNPMGGCFPILIQIPVFLGLYNALLNALELRHAPYAGWITDLSAPENLQVFGIGVPVMVLLMAATMVYQTWTAPNPSADPAQQKMMMIMPVVFAGMFIVFPMPAGLVLYWLTNNIISIVQQLYMRKSDKGAVYIGTAVASAVIFGVGYLLTLI